MFRTRLGDFLRHVCKGHQVFLIHRVLGFSGILCKIDESLAIISSIFVSALERRPRATEVNLECNYSQSVTLRKTR